MSVTETHPSTQPSGRFWLASYPEGVAATALVSIVEVPPACTRHVWQESPSPAYPFDAWSNAAHTIQEAVDAYEKALSIDARIGVARKLEKLRKSLP